MVILTALLVLAAGIFQLATGPGKSAVTIDEPVQLLRTGSWLAGGDYLAPSLVEPGASVGSKYVYGPAYSVIAHSLNVVTGNEAWDEVSFSDAAVVNRHLVAALFAALASIVIGFATGFATGSRMLGLWTAAALLSIPLWTGMGFFNPKDTPVAAGYTFFTAALIFGLRPRSGGKRPEPWDLLVFGLTAAGFFMAIGTRLAMWLPLAFSLAFFFLLAFQARRSEGAGIRWPAVLVGILAGFISLVVLYPGVFANPVEFISKTLSDSSDFTWDGFTLTYARLMTEHPPWWYLPAWTFASIPLLIGAAGLLGLVGFVRKLWIEVRQGRLKSRQLGLREASTLLILVQLLLLPLSSMLVGATMYTGLRQHLYMLPAVAMLAGIGASYLLGWNSSRPASHLRGWLIAIGLSIALVVPMAEQARLFPFNYVYVNPIAGIQGVNDRWEGDYWSVGLKEASEKVPAGEVAWCGTVYGGKTPSPADLQPCSNLLRPYAIQDEADSTDRATQWTLLRRRAGASLPPFCQPVDNVTRQLRGEEIVITYVALCEVPPKGE